jgi:vesicle-associated membrane protein 7
MSLLEYSAVVRGSTIIASFGDLSGVSERDIVRLLPPPTTRVDQKITSGKLLSFTTTTSLAFVAVSPQSVDKQRPLAFLDTLSRRWVSSFGVVSASAADHALDRVFASHFAALFDDFSNATKTSELVRELDDAEQILTSGMTKALDRGAELESISSKSETLMSTSEEFRAKAASLKWKMRCQYIKSWLWWILCIVAIIYLLLSFACGGLGLETCLRS